MHEPLRFIAIIGKAREAAEIVWGDEAEAIPTVSPGIADASAVEDDMVPPGLCEMPAHGQSGLSAADHNRVNQFCHADPPVDEIECRQDYNANRRSCNLTGQKVRTGSFPDPQRRIWPTSPTPSSWKRAGRSSRSRNFQRRARGNRGERYTHSR